MTRKAISGIIVSLDDVESYMGDLSRNFSKREFACHCGKCDMKPIDPRLIDLLEGVRHHFETLNARAKVLITSGYRCEQHNKAVGGAHNSMHLTGNAADIKVFSETAQINPDFVAAYLEAEHPNSHGIGRYKRWTHIDTRMIKARWRG